MISLKALASGYGVCGNRGLMPIGTPFGNSEPQCASMWA